jgi:hypothetical protein
MPWRAAAIVAALHSHRNNAGGRVEPVGRNRLIAPYRAHGNERLLDCLPMRVLEASRWNGAIKRLRPAAITKFKTAERR